MRSVSHRSLFLAGGLVAVSALFVIVVLRSHPANFFGLTQDDSIYFSSAKALADGNGYVLPSFPGTPAATKYPEFYPWLLSWVWRGNPSFPANLPNAIAVTIAFGIAYIIAVLFLLRGLRGIGDLEAFLLTGFCALHPLVIFCSGQLLSDIPFAFFTIAAITLARQEEPHKPDAAVVACGLLTGLAVLTRVLGVPVAAGIAVAFVMRRSWRRLALFCVSLAPFSCVLALRPIFAHAKNSAVAVTALNPGWLRTWAYYTNYVKDWRQSVPSGSIFAAMLSNNWFWLLRAPADYFIPQLPTQQAIVVAAVKTALTFVVVKGLFRLSDKARTDPIYWILAFYASVVLLWNYPLANRFLIPFLPIFAAALWVEGKSTLTLVRTTLSGSRQIAEKLTAAGFCVVIVCAVVGVLINYVSAGRKPYSERNSLRAAILPEKREAYDWLARSTKANTRVVAYEDAVLFLYSQRAAVRPVTFPTVVFYDPPKLVDVLSHITDVARAIGADYWVACDDDYTFEGTDAYVAAKSRMKQVEKVLPLAYTSRYGHVRIYSLGCIRHPEDSSCEIAKNVLFPGSASVVPEPMRVSTSGSN